MKPIVFDLFCINQANRRKNKLEYKIAKRKNKMQQPINAR